jgi:uncharacterized membrane protein
MHLVDISNIISNIEQKTNALVAELRAVREENAKLNTQNRDLMAQNRALQTDLLLRDSEISHLKKHSITEQEVVRTEAGTQNHQLRKEIDQYIVDIDKCIEWLQNQ